jgi:hypothetical protein
MSLLTTSLTGIESDREESRTESGNIGMKNEN